MQDLFDDLGKRISETADEVVKRTGDAVEVQRIKAEIRTLKRSNERDYIDIGKMIYEKFLTGEVVDESFIGFCEEIETRDEKIEEYNDEINRIKEMKV
ncbi:MAG: hypothetical protein ACRC3H_06395 [Lachnospiraceae bacterium]